MRTTAQARTLEAARKAAFDQAIQTYLSISKMPEAKNKPGIALALMEAGIKDLDEARRILAAAEPDDTWRAARTHADIVASMSRVLTAQGVMPLPPRPRTSGRLADRMRDMLVVEGSRRK